MGKREFNDEVYFSFLRYRPFNNNRKREKTLLSKMIEGSSLEESQKLYLEGRFFDAYNALDALAISNKIFFQFLKLCVLMSGILIVALVNFEIDFMGLDTTMVITILSVLSSVAFSILQFFKNDIMWAHHRLKFEDVRKELFLFLNLREKYERPDEFTGDAWRLNDAFPFFVDRVEFLFDAEIKDYFTNLQIGGNYVEIYKKMKEEIEASSKQEKR